jgi:anti-sigma B factor antagonist
MELRITDYRGTKIIEPSGEIDMYSSPALREEIMALINKGTSPLLIDFKGVSYIDSSGIATFVEGLKNMMDTGGRLVLVSIPETIMEIFSFSRLDKVFEIQGTIDDVFNS